MYRALSSVVRAGPRTALIATVALGGAGAVAHPEIDWQIRELTSRIAADPQNTELLLRRGELHRVHGDPVAAEADFRLARSVDPGLYVVDYYLARVRLDAGEPAQAEALLSALLGRLPEHAPSLVERAHAREALGRHLEAAADWERAIAVDPRPGPDHYLGLAAALAAAGPEHRARAIERLDQGLVRLGEPVSLALRAIELELAGGRTDAAIARLEKIADRSPRKEPWLVRRAEILEGAGRRDDARRSYEEALQAIDALPPLRRTTPAVGRLREQALAAVARLEAPATDHAR
jgi:tetratricopeptide (TPR) repeat protein